MIKILYIYTDYHIYRCNKKTFPYVHGYKLSKSCIHMV